MTTKRVVFELEVNAETSLEAAKIIQDYLQNPNNNWQFYVQDCDSSKNQCQTMTICFSKHFIDFVTSVSVFVKSPELLRPSFKMLFAASKSL